MGEDFLRSCCLTHSLEEFCSLLKSFMGERGRDFLLSEKKGDRENGQKEELIICEDNFPMQEVLGKWNVYGW